MAPPGGGHLTSIQRGSKAGASPPEPPSNPPRGFLVHPLNLDVPEARTHRAPTESVLPFRKPRTPRVGSGGPGRKAWRLRPAPPLGPQRRLVPRVLAGPDNLPAGSSLLIPSPYLTSYRAAWCAPLLLGSNLR